MLRRVRVAVGGAVKARSHSRAVAMALLAGTAISAGGIGLAPTAAFADNGPCVVSGNATTTACDRTNGVAVFANSGAVTMTVDGITIPNNTVTFQPGGAAIGPFDLTLTMRNTTVNATTYGALNMASERGRNQRQRDAGIERISHHECRVRRRVGCGTRSAATSP